MVSECIEVAGINRVTGGSENRALRPSCVAGKLLPTAAKTPAEGSWQAAGAGGTIREVMVVVVDGSERRPRRNKEEEDE